MICLLCKVQCNENTWRRLTLEHFVSVCRTSWLSSLKFFLLSIFKTARSFIVPRLSNFNISAWDFSVILFDTSVIELNVLSQFNMLHTTHWYSENNLRVMATDREAIFCSVFNPLVLCCLFDDSVVFHEWVCRREKWVWYDGMCTQWWAMLIDMFWYLEKMWIAFNCL